MTNQRNPKIEHTATLVCKRNQVGSYCVKRTVRMKRDGCEPGGYHRCANSNLCGWVPGRSEAMRPLQRTAPASCHPRAPPAPPPRAERAPPAIPECRHRSCHPRAAAFSATATAPALISGARNTRTQKYNKFLGRRVGCALLNRGRCSEKMLGQAKLFRQNTLTSGLETNALIDSRAVHKRLQQSIWHATVHPFRSSDLLDVCLELVRCTQNHSCVHAFDMN